MTIGRNNDEVATLIPPNMKQDTQGKISTKTQETSPASLYNLAKINHSLKNHYVLILNNMSKKIRKF